MKMAVYRGAARVINRGILLSPSLIYLSFTVSQRLDGEFQRENCFNLYNANLVQQTLKATQGQYRGNQDNEAKWPSLKWKWEI